MSSCHPVLPSQIEAATELWSTVDSWVGTDSALNALAKGFPENDHDSILLKVVTVNALYSTNVYVSTAAENYTG
jgi:hypothetical protein